MEVDTLRTLENVEAHSPHEPYPDEVTPSIGDDGSDIHILRKLREWWDQSREIQAENREEQASDWDFYDGLQWTNEEKDDLAERGQAPYVFNIVKPTIDWMIGTQKRTKMDHRVLGRLNNKEAREDADAKSMLLKYLDDVNHVQHHRSRAFRDAVKSGVGWLEDGARNDESDEVLYSRAESWRNIWYDHLSVEPDLSDARYLFRAKWTDTDYLIAMFPEHEAVIRQATTHQSQIGGDDDADDFWYSRTTVDGNNGNYGRGRGGAFGDQGNVFSTRERVRPIECWYRVPARVKKMRGFDPGMEGKIYDESDQQHLAAVEGDIVSLYDAVVMEMWVAIFINNAMLQNVRSPYNHGDFPFTPIWTYRRGRDNAPYGPIRNIRDPQDDLNKRGSKSLFILSTNQVIAEESAVEDNKWDEVIDEAARPDGVIKLRTGALSGGRFQINRDTQLAEEHISLMDRDQAMVRNVSGVQGENLGADTSSISGKAVLAKQNEGSVVTGELFDNLRFARALQGRKRVSLIEQYIDMPKTIRVTGERGSADFMDVNIPEWDPIDGKWVFKNDMTQFQADFIIDEQDFRASIRQAMFDQLMDMVSKLDSSISLQLLDLVFEMSELPEKEELVSRVRKVNGQQAPDAEPTPEEQSAKAAQQQKAQAAERLQIRDILSKIQEREAKTEETRVKTQKAAIDAGITLVTAPTAAGAADQVLASAGYDDAGGQAESLPQPPAEPQLQLSGQHAPRSGTTPAVSEGIPAES